MSSSTQSETQQNPSSDHHADPPDSDPPPAKILTLDSSPDRHRNPLELNRSDDAGDDFPTNDADMSPPSATASVANSLRRGTKRKKGRSNKRRGPSVAAQEKKSMEKYEVLIETLKPVPFVPGKNLDFARHEKLLKRLGLWDFVHIEFDSVIRKDLLAQLIANYNKPKSQVNSVRVTVSRADLARALKLTVKMKKLVLEDDEREVTEESIAFVEDFVSNWLLLHDDTWMMPHEVLNWMKAIKEGNFEKLDWASIIWFMIEKELMMAPQLAECYYASHLQCLIKSQRKELIDDAVEADGEPKVAVDVKEDLVVVEEEEEPQVDCSGDLKLGLSNSSGDVMISEFVEGGGDAERVLSEGGGDVKLNSVNGTEDLKANLVDDVGDVKMGPGDVETDSVKHDDSGDVKMGLGDVERDLVKLDGSEDVKREMVDGSEDLMMGVVDDGGEVQIGMTDGSVDLIARVVDGGEDVKIDGVDDNGDARADRDDSDFRDGCDLGEHNNELSLGGQDNAVVEHDMGLSLGWQDTIADNAEDVGKQEEPVGDEGLIEVEETKEEANEPAQWFFGKSSLGGEDMFLRQCSFGVELNNDLGFGDERKGEEEVGEGEQEEQEEEEEEEEEDEEGVRQDDEEEGQEEEEEEDDMDDDHDGEQGRREGGFNLSPKGMSLDGFHSGSMIHSMDVGQMNLPLRDSLGGEFFSSRDDDRMPTLFGNGGSSKRENDNSHHSLNANKRPRIDSTWDNGKMSADFDTYMDQIQQLVGKARMIHNAKEQAYQESAVNSQLMMHELQQRDSIIEHLHKARFEEQQRRQMEVGKLETELNLMSNLLQGYRKALRETQKAFTEYRERNPQHIEPLYKDVAGSGGLVLSVMEIEKRRLKQEEEDRTNQMKIEGQVNIFEVWWDGKFAEFSENINMLAEKLLILENVTGLLKESHAKRKASETPKPAPIESTETSEPAQMESSDAPEPTQVESSEAPEPVNVESSEAPVPAQVESSETLEPAQV